MSGARYTDWTHTRVLGDRDAAAPYVPEARKLLGFVIDEAKRNGLGVHQITRDLPDGTRIIAEKHGEIPRITIVPVPGGQGKPEPETPDDFVVWSRDQGQPAGIDAECPQQILRAQRPEDGASSFGGITVTGSKPVWKTFFFKAETAGHEDFPGRKGTYFGMFPEGVRFAGNVDWKGPVGQRVSWYGPSTRYWYDPHIKPRQQYGKFVFLLGHKLLDVEQYLLDSDPDPAFAARWVMGAALDGNRLYVVHAELPEPVTDTTPGPADRATVDQPWPVGDVLIEVCTYAVARTDAVTWDVVAGSRQVLWSGSLANALNPWFFNESVTAAVSVALPGNVVAQQHIDPPADFSLRTPAPSGDQAIHTFRRTDDGPVLESTSVSLSTGPSEATVAVDFVGDQMLQMKMQRYPQDELQDVFALELAGTTWPLATGLWLGVIDTRASYRVHARFVMHADIREQAVVVHHSERTVRINTFAIDISESVEIWRKGALVVRHELTDAPLNTGWTRSMLFLPGLSGGDADTLGIVSGIALAPSFPLYQIYTAHQQTNPSFLWQGAHGLVSYLGYPAASRFGTARWNTSITDRLDNYTDESGLRITADFDGNNSVLGCATANGITMLSCYAFEYQTGRSLNYVDDGQLPELTGLVGEDARYHPIWLLGKQPPSTDD